MNSKDLSALADRRYQMIQKTAQTVISPQNDQSSRQHDVLVAMARSELKARQRQKEIFSEGEVFGEPAFEILLDVYIACAEDRPVTATQVCANAGVSATIGARHMAILERQGLISRHRCTSDFRCTYVRPTRLGTAKVNEFYLSRLENNDLF